MQVNKYGIFFRGYGTNWLGVIFTIGLSFFGFISDHWWIGFVLLILVPVAIWCRGYADDIFKVVEKKENDNGSA